MINSLRENSGRVVQPIDTNGAPKSFAVCAHTLELFDGQGCLRGTWQGDVSPYGIRYACCHCGKFYGYQPNRKSCAAFQSSGQRSD